MDRAEASMDTLGHGDTAGRLELGKRGWPILHSAAEPCDGIHPATRRACVLGYHRGFHRDTVGAEWLDD